MFRQRNPFAVTLIPLWLIRGISLIYKDTQEILCTSEFRTKGRGLALAAHLSQLSARYQ